MISLGEALLKMSADPSGLDPGLNAAEKRVGSFGASMTRILETATGVSLSNMTERLLAMPRQLTSMALGAIASYESLSLSLETLAAKELRAADSTLSLEDAMLQAKDAAKETIGWVEQLAVKSPFTTQGVAQALKMAQAYGFTTEEAKRMTQALIDFAAGSGAGEYAMQRIAMVMGQIKGAGRLLGQDMMQLTSTGLPVLQILADGFGVTTAEIVKMREKGLIPAQEAIEHITRYLETSFAGAAARQASSWAGLLSTIQDLKDIAIRDFFTPMFTTVQPYVQKFVDTLGSDALRAKLKEIGTLLADKIGAAIVQVTEHATQMLQVGRDILTVMVSIKAVNFTANIVAGAAVAITKLSELLAVQRALAAMEGVTGFAATVGGLQSIASAAFAALNPIFLVVAAIGALIGAFVILKQHQDAARQAAYDQAGQIATAATSYYTYVSQMQAAKLNTDYVTEAVYRLIQAHRDQVTAANIAQYTEMLDTWKQKLQALEVEQQRAAGALAQFLGIYDTNAIQANIDATKEEIAQYAARNEVFAAMATAAGLLTAADKERIAVIEEMIASDDNLARGLTVVSEEVAKVTAATAEQVPAVGELASAWQAAWEGIEAAQTEYADENQAKVMESFERLQEQYADHAVNIAKLEWEKQQALTDLQEEYETLRARLIAAHDNAGLAQLVNAVKNKQTGILTYYNNRIKIEQTGQQTVYDTAKRYYKVTLTILKEQLRTQLQQQVENMKAMVKAVTGGYGSMSAAADAYNRIVKGQEAIEATNAAIANVQAAYDAIEDAGVAAADAALKEFSAWEAATDNLGDSLGDLGGSMDEVKGKSGSAGSSVSTKFKDPVEEAAKAVERIGQMVERAVEAFDMLAGYRGPKAGWQEKFIDLMANVSEMILATSKTAEQLKAAGFYAIEDERTGAGPLARLLSFVNAVSNVATMLTKVADVVNVAGTTKLPKNFSIVEANLLFLVNVLKKMTTLLLDVMRDTQFSGVTEQFKKFAEYIQSVVAPIRETLALTAELHALISRGEVITNSESLPKPLVFLVSVLKKLAILLQDALNDPALANIGEQFKTFNERLKTILAPVRETLTFIAELRALVTSGEVITNSESLPKPLIFLVSVIKKLAVLMSDAMRDPLLASIDEEFKNFAERIKTVIAPVRETLAFIAELRALVTSGEVITNSESMPTPLVFLVNVLKRMAELMQAAMRDPLLAGVTEQFKTFNEQIRSVIAPFKDTLSFIKDLRAAVVGGDLKLFDATTALTQLKTFLEQMVTTLLALMDAPIMKRLDDAVVKFASQLSAIGEYLSRAVNFLTDLRLWRYQKSLTAQFMTFANAWLMIIQVLDQLRIAVAKYITESFKTFIRNLGYIGENLQKAITSLQALSAWKRTVDLKQKAQDFANALVVILETLADSLAENQEELANLNADEFGAAFGALMEGLKEALELALAMPASWTLDQNVFDQFFEWATGAFWTFVDDVTTWAAKQADPANTATLVGVLAQAFSALIEALRGALDLAIAFSASNWSVPDPTKWLAFENWIYSAFWRFVDAVTDWVDEQIAAGNDPTATSSVVSTMVNALKTLIEALRGALDLAIAFSASNWSIPDSEKWYLFESWIYGAFWRFVKSVTDWAEEQNDPTEMATIVGTMAQAFKTLIEALRGALDLALAFPANWLPPDPVTWNAFMTWVEGVFDEFTRYVTEWAKKQSNPKDQLTFIGQFAQTLATLMSALQTALVVAAAVPATWKIDQAVWDKFMTWVENVFTKFTDYVTEWAKNETNPDAKLGTVGQFAQALNGLMSGLLAALNVAATVPATWEISDAVWGDFMTWVEAVMNRLTTWVRANFPSDYNFEPVQSFGVAMQNVFGGLAAGIAVFKGLQGLIPLKDNKITDFLTHVKLVMEEISNWCTTEQTAIRKIVGDGTTLGDFGTAMSNVFSGLQSGLSLFDALADLTGSTEDLIGTARGPNTPPGPNDTLARKLGALLAAIRVTLEAFGTFAQENKGDWLTQATKLKTVISEVIGVLTEALNLFIALDEHGMPTTTQIQAFVDALIGPTGIFTIFMAGLADILTQIRDNNKDIGAALADLVLYLPTNYAMQQMGRNLMQQLALGMTNYSHAELPTMLQIVGNNLKYLLEDLLAKGSNVANSAWQKGVSLGGYIIEGLAYGIHPDTAAGNKLNGLASAIGALVAYVEAQTEAHLESGSPSMLFARLASSIPQGIALGITSGTPKVLSAADALFGQLTAIGEVAPAWAIGGEVAVTGERHIVVDFTGEAIGGVPLNPLQFQELKSALAYEIRRRA